jgi:hypothetical protein
MSLEALPFSSRGLKPELILSSNAVEFGGSGISLAADAATYVFGEAETLLIRGVSSQSG